MEPSPADECNVSHDCFCLMSSVQRGLFSYQGHITPGDDRYTLGRQTSCLGFVGQVVYLGEKLKKRGGGEGRNTTVRIQYGYSAAQLAFIGQTRKQILGGAKLLSALNSSPILRSVFVISCLFPSNVSHYGVI